MIGIEQHRRKQILWLMYVLSKNNTVLHVPIGETRNVEKLYLRYPLELRLNMKILHLI